jgi:hypothetical protein
MVVRWLLCLPSAQAAREALDVLEGAGFREEELRTEADDDWRLTVVRSYASGDFNERDVTRMMQQLAELHGGHLQGSSVELDLPTS